MACNITIDFFHDVVCGWCFNVSPRLRRLVGEFDLDVRHHTFVLQEDRDRMVAVFGSMRRAKETILGHWAACRAASDRPELFNVDGMRRARFDYPHGLPGALACKAAERMGDQEAHWVMFDAIQRAHISAVRNVADHAVLRRIAADLGFEPDRFAVLMSHPQTREAVAADCELARRLQVRTVPTLIVRETGARLVNGPVEDLRAQLRAAQKLVA